MRDGQELGRAVFAVTDNDERVREGRLKKAMSACKAKCKAEHPDCSIVIATIDSKGVCRCACADFDTPIDDLGL